MQLNNTPMKMRITGYMHSLEILLSIIGNPAIGTRSERITFNGQYDQQLNQIECSIKKGRTRNTNGSEEKATLTLIPYGCTNLRIAEFRAAAGTETKND
jgi:hypothetical protein